MQQLLDSLLQFLQAGWDVLRSVFGLIEPNLGLFVFLAAWIAYWLFAANWLELRRVLLGGGWVGLVLLGLVAVLVWGSVHPPVTMPDMKHNILGLKLSNYVGKTVYVTGAMCIMLICGSIQLSGLAGRTPVEESPTDSQAAH